MYWVYRGVVGFPKSEEKPKSRPIRWGDLQAPYQGFAKFHISNQPPTRDCGWIMDFPPNKNAGETLSFRN